MGMDIEILEILKNIQNDIKEIKSSQNETCKKINNIESQQGELKTLITELEPKNANRHIEISNKIDEVSQRVDLLRQDFNKVEVVTSQNSFEIQYLKAVK
jgi:chromosome segregation ATPase